eukprot:CAMPEP_0117456136 /NCGR_PEP_ID=MMETSP0759-20121206/11722_1 /TAXON_ID=63605 /ORGANISM="Percolomonas cosmopolitus, Strain WS" /LENGTH=84 /DNA_ID=CAMNT_0005249467 /DNA_START=313 /DNA_END=564 /DNA_ORIENTATION=-
MTAITYPFLVTFCLTRFLRISMEAFKAPEMNVVRIEGMYLGGLCGDGPEGNRALATWVLGEGTLLVEFMEEVDGWRGEGRCKGC